MEKVCSEDMARVFTKGGGIVVIVNWVGRLQAAAKLKVELVGARSASKVLLCLGFGLG